MDEVFGGQGSAASDEGHAKCCSRWNVAFESASSSDLEAYDEVLVPRVFVPLASALLEEVAIEPGDTVLDVACGTGSVARLAAVHAGPGGCVTGCDASAGMISIAKRKSWLPGGTQIEYLQASAEQLPISDETVDVVTCQQGLQFFADREKALREILRVLRPGGRVGVAVWSEIELSPPFAALERAIGDVAGRETADAYRMGPWGFPDGNAIRELFERVGFSDTCLHQCMLPVTFEEGPAQVVATLAFVGTTAEIDRLPGGRQRIIRAVTTHTRDMTTGGELKSYVTANIVTGTS